MARTENLASYMVLEMVKNARSKVAAVIKQKNSNTLEVYSVLMLWKSMVGNRRPWDHKPFIKKTYGEWSRDSDTNTQFNFDIWSNIHYGYVGRSVGFSAWTLKAGAGYAQKMAGTNPPGYWMRRIDSLGDADFLAAFDDPKDQAAIVIGINLWDQYKLNISTNKLVSAIRARRFELQTK
ncbi:MAG: polymorphic toxin type 44 domain-containing protein [Pseudomonadota bacterium]